MWRRFEGGSLIKQGFIISERSRGEERDRIGGIENIKGIEILIIVDYQSVNLSTWAGSGLMLSLLLQQLHLLSSSSSNNKNLRDIL